MLHAHEGLRGRQWILLPREHGAWGLLLQPFFASAVLVNQWGFDLAVALVTLLSAFLCREPLLILARQRWVWRQPRPETKDVVFVLSWLMPVLIASRAILLIRLPKFEISMLCLLGVGMTGLVTWMGVLNRQRSISLQIVSAFGWGSAAHLAALCSEGRIEGWVWIVWFYISSHAASGICTVHTRLRLTIARDCSMPTWRD
jgi:hypothetical protein